MYLQVEPRFFVVNENGKHVKFPQESSKYSDGPYNRIRLDLNHGKKSATLKSIANNCRETVGNDLGRKLVALIPILEAKGLKISLEPPLSSRGRVMALPTGTMVFTQRYERFANLDTSRKRKQLRDLIDVMVGPVAMLVGGPKAYILRGNRRVITQRRIPVDCLSNSWMKHPAIYSLLAGVARGAIYLHEQAGYEKIDKAIDIADTLKLLRTISRNKILTAKRREELLVKVSKLRRTLKRRKLNERMRWSVGVGALNLLGSPRNWGMFNDMVEPSKQAISGGMLKNWRLCAGWGALTYGFNLWCLKRQAALRRKKKRAGR